MLTKTRQANVEETKAPGVWWSPQEISAAQRADPDINCVLKRLEEDNSKPSPKEMQRMSYLSRAIWAQYELLQLTNGVLYILPYGENKRYRARVILLESLINPALSRVHDGLEGCHLGQFKTLRKMQARFWLARFYLFVHLFSLKWWKTTWCLLNWRGLLSINSMFN